MDSEQGKLDSELVRLQEALAKASAQRNTDAEVALQAAQRLHLLESVMETVPVGIVITDASGKIVHGNSRVQEMVRHPVLHSEDADSYGEWVSFHQDGRRVESHEYPLSKVIRDGANRAELDVHYQRGDGTRFWMRIIGEPVLNNADERIGATVALIDIDEERQLRAAQSILIAELNHRVKNAFSVVKSIVSQSLRKVSVQHGLRETIDRRLDAYAGAHAKLIGTAWDHAPIAAIAEGILNPIGGGRVHLDGPQVEVPSRQALAFSMAFYELATNAVKYGALSVPDGSVDLTWELLSESEHSFLEMKWIERGGPVPSEPEEKGFGSFITGRALQMETTGSVRSAYPVEGYEWHLRMPIETQNQGKA